MLALATCLFPLTAADATVKIHDLEGNLAITLIGHTQGISDVAWTQDSSHVATASDDKLIKVWDVETVRNMCCNHFLSHVFAFGTFAL
jgi:WD40 repeat protein